MLFHHSSLTIPPIYYHVFLQHSSVRRSLNPQIGVTEKENIALKTWGLPQPWGKIWNFKNIWGGIFSLKTIEYCLHIYLLFHSWMVVESCNSPRSIALALWEGIPLDAWEKQGAALVCFRGQEPRWSLKYWFCCVWEARYCSSSSSIALGVSGRLVFWSQ